MKMMVKTFVNNPFQENTYLLADNESRQCVLVDPGMSNESEWNRVRDFIEKEGLTPVAVWLTHCHVDHEMGTGYLTEAYGLPVCGPMEDYVQLPTPQRQAQLFGVSCDKEVTPVTHNVKEGDILQVGNLQVKVLDIPGHSHHGLCYVVPDEFIVLTGDVLFYCSVGRSDFGPGMGCDGEALIEGIRCKLLSLPAETRVLPGHGPSTTISQEINMNPYI